SFGVCLTNKLMVNKFFVLTWGILCFAASFSAHVMNARHFSVSRGVCGNSSAWLHVCKLLRLGSLLLIVIVLAGISVPAQTDTIESLTRSIEARPKKAANYLKRGE